MMITKGILIFHAKLPMAPRRHVDLSDRASRTRFLKQEMWYKMWKRAICSILPLYSHLPHFCWRIRRSCCEKRVIATQYWTHYFCWMWPKYFRRCILNILLYSKNGSVYIHTEFLNQTRTVLSTEVLVKNCPSLLSQIDVTAPVWPDSLKDNQ